MKGFFKITILFLWLFSQLATVTYQDFLDGHPLTAVILLKLFKTDDIRNVGEKLSVEIKGKDFGFIRNKISDFIRYLGESSNLDFKRVLNERYTAYNQTNRIISSLYDSYKMTLTPSDNARLIESFANKCLDNSTGIHIVISKYIQFLHSRSISTVLVDLIKYESYEWNRFIQSLLGKMVKIWVLTDACEEATNKKLVDFQTHVFILEVTNYLDYMRNYYIKVKFTRDKVALKNSIEKLVSTAHTPNDVVRNLTELYQFYDWSVLYISNSVNDGFRQYWTSFKENANCGTHLFESRSNGLVALVSWSSRNETKRQDRSYDIKKQMSQNDDVKINQEVSALNGYYNFIHGVNPERCVNSKYDQYTVDYVLLDGYEHIFYYTSVVHVWLFDPNLNDIINGVTAIESFNTTFIKDQGPVVDLSNGFIKLPKNIFLNKEFSVRLIVKFKEYGNWQVLFRFGTNERVNDFVVGISLNRTQSTINVYTDDNHKSHQTKLKRVLVLNRWIFLLFVYQNTTLSVFQNDTLQDVMNDVYIKTGKSFGYFGKSIWDYGRDLNATIKYVAITSKPMSDSEIRSIFRNYNKMNAIKKFSDVPKKLTTTSTATNDGLIHHWSFNMNFNDVIGGKDIIEYENVAFENGHDGSINGAIRILNGFLKLPVGVYFHSDFTVSFWIKFSYDVPIDKYLFSFSGPDNNEIYAHIDDSGISLDLNDMTLFHENYEFSLNTWYHIAYAVSGLSDTVDLFIDAVLVYSSKYDVGSVFKVVQRNFNYIGTKDCRNNIDAIFDEFKIFNRTLTINEIYKNFVL